MVEATQQKALSKSEKAAVLLLCMDEKATGELFNQMEDDEIRKMTSALLHLNQIPTVQIQQVMEEFGQGMVKILQASKQPKEGPGEIPIDGHRMAENLLVRSLDRGRSRQILSTLKSPSKASPEDEANFRQLIQETPTEDLIEIIKDEHPQIIAITLANVKRSAAKEILAKLPDDRKVDIVSRMARLEKISGLAMQELRRYLVERMNEKQAGAGGGAKQEVPENQDLPIEGLGGTVLLLKSLKKDESMKLVDEIIKLDSEVGELISKQMFTMEDLERANDTGIRELLRGITNDDLKVALKNAPDPVKEKIFKNMSERASLILKEDIEVMGPLKVEDIEAAQANILKVAKDLMKEDKLILADIADEG